MAGPVTLESLNARMDVSDARLDRVESDIATLKTDVAVVKTDVAVLKADVSTLKTHAVELKVAVHRLESDMSHMVDRIDDLHLQAKSMTSAVMEALTQLNLSRTYEKRLDRLETAVFGKTD